VEKVTRLSIPAPQVLIAEILINPRLTFGDVAGVVLVTYCPVTCAGAVFFREAEMCVFIPRSPQASFCAQFKIKDSGFLLNLSKPHGSPKRGPEIANGSLLLE
jgi:hypothetical protein